MGNCWRKFLQCCCFFQKDRSLEKQPLLQDEESGHTESAPQETPQAVLQTTDTTPLLDEHDSIYTQFGEAKTSSALQRTTSHKVSSPRHRPRKKYKRLASEPQILPPEKIIPEINDEDKSGDEIDSISSVAPTKRQLTAMELLQTETTYIRNLKIIIEIYKQPLENAAKRGEQILAAEDVRNIFGGISDILKVHTQMHQELSEVISEWEEDCCIAKIMTKYQSQLTKVYPPYVNYFDMGKDIIVKQKKVNTVFMEFLINCFNNPTCLKQPLDALLIRPVQRLPSMSLLISDLQRRTPENLQDYTELEKAKEALKQVLSHINEDKRKTEGKTKIFDIIYEVESCPVEIVSSNRLFVSRVNVTSLNEGLYRAGDRLALYLLTDIIEVSKFKQHPGRNSPLLKHIRLLELSDIKCLIDINDTEESQNMFAIQLVDEPKTNNSATQYTDKLCVCQVLDDRIYKDEFLKNLKAQLEANGDKIRDEQILKKMDPSEVQPLLGKGFSRVFRKARGKSKRD